MTPTELEAYDAMMHDRDRWKERAERLERLCPSGAAPCSAERLARELALNYYQGSYREKYSHQNELTRVTGVMKVGMVDTQQWIEEQAQDMANRFWHSWEAEAAQLLLPNAGAVTRGETGPSQLEKEGS